MHRILYVLFIIPWLSISQSFISTGEDLIFVTNGTKVASVDGFKMKGDGQSRFSLHQGSYPSNTFPYSKRTLIDNPNARFRIRNVGLSQLAEFFIDVFYSNSKASADLTIQNNDVISAFYDVGIVQIDRPGYNDIPIDWNITKLGAFLTDSFNITFKWDEILESQQIPLKRVFMFKNEISDWIQLPRENTIINEQDNTITYNGLERILHNTRFMVAQAIPEVHITSDLNDFDWCIGYSSNAQSFLVEAKDITDVLHVVAPSNFEVSLHEEGPYHTVLDIEPVENDVQPTEIFIRISENANSVGVFEGVVLTTDVFYGTFSETIQVTSLPDVENPTVVAPSDVIIEAVSSCSVENVALGEVEASDNCNITSISNDAPEVFSYGTTIVTWTVTDGIGNFTSVTQNVTVQDTTPPQVIVKNIAIPLDQEGNAFLTPDMINDGSFDNCIIQTFELDIDTFNCTNVGDTSVILTLTDTSGNSASGTAMVTIEDTTPPIIQTKNIEVELNAEGFATLVPEMLDNGSVDNCTLSTYEVSNEVFTCENIGENQVFFKVTDINGNESESIVMVSVVSNYPDSDSDGLRNNCDDDDDNDGLSDEDEIDYNTDPLNQDTDGDGVIDGTEVNDTSSPTDYCDFVLTSQTETPSEIWLNSDCDGDELLNTDEISIGTDPLNDDTDGDDMKDNDEILLGTDPLNPDTDDDGLLDGEEIVIGTDPLNPDTDEDSIMDGEDDCPLQSNASQDDNDQDGMGNICDEDDDNDGVLDINDNCPMSYNPMQGDRDGDGIGDVCDLIEINISNAITPNGDGVNDTWMIYNIENHPNNTVRVFNRWGDQVFSARGYKNDWDGYYKQRSTNLPSASSYYYQIDLDGNGNIDYDGWLTIFNN